MAGANRKATRTVRSTETKKKPILITQQKNKVSR